MTPWLSSLARLKLRSKALSVEVDSIEAIPQGVQQEFWTAHFRQ